jgi:hypothetical protein
MTMIELDVDVPPMSLLSLLYAGAKASAFCTAGSGSSSGSSAAR